VHRRQSLHGFVILGGCLSVSASLRLRVEIPNAVFVTEVHKLALVPIRGQEVSNGMQIRIVIRLSPVKPAHPVQTIGNVFKQLPCRIGHHEEKLEITRGRLAIRCLRCGWVSPGWDLESREATTRPDQPNSGRQENQNVLAAQATVHLGQPEALGL
jgi:hypothetical protein